MPCRSRCPHTAIGGLPRRKRESDARRKRMRVFKTMFAALLAALMLVSLPGCKKEKEFVVPSNMTREEAALFTAIANVCPKDDNHSKVEYLTFFIEGWSFDKLPPEITSYLTEYCANSGANLVQLSYKDLVAQGYITKGDGDFTRPMTTPTRWGWERFSHSPLRTAKAPMRTHARLPSKALFPKATQAGLTLSFNTLTAHGNS